VISPPHDALSVTGYNPARDTDTQENVQIFLGQFMSEIAC
jgi:hypothetical protein